MFVAWCCWQATLHWSIVPVNGQLLWYGALVFKCNTYEQSGANACWPVVAGAYRDYLYGKIPLSSASPDVADSRTCRSLPDSCRRPAAAVLQIRLFCLIINGWLMIKWECVTEVS
jgi:hypothetical protein